MDYQTPIQHPICDEPINVTMPFSSKADFARTASGRIGLVQSLCTSSQSTRIPCDVEQAPTRWESYKLRSKPSSVKSRVMQQTKSERF